MPTPFDADRKWLRADVAAHYDRERYASGRAAARDPRHITRLLGRHLAPVAEARVLDVPCGTGRLRDALSPHAAVYVGADRSPSMLAAASAHDGGPWVLASVARLPFAAGSFDAVVCCRLLHHLDEGRELPGALAELVRVSRELVVASFWDHASWPAFRRRRGWRVDETGRRAVRKARLAAIFDELGADVLGWTHSFRFLSQQAFCVARKRCP